MENTKNVLYKIFVCIVGFLTFIAVCILIAWFYLWFSNKFPESSGTNYVTSVTDCNGNKYRFLELNYFDNKNGTGKEVAEITFNYYTDENMTNVMSTVVQRVTNDDGSGNITYDYYYYEIAPEVNVTWSPVQKPGIGENSKTMYVDINGEPFAIRFDKTYNVISKNFAGAKAIFRGTFGWLWGMDYKDDSNFFNYSVKSFDYTFEDFVNACVNHLTVSNKSYGSYNLPFVNLTDYLSVNKFDSEKKQWVEYSNVTELRNFFSFDVKTSRYGMIYASQSKVKIVANDPHFNISGLSGEGSKYWKHFVVYNLTEEDFDLNYSALNEGYNLSLREEIIDHLMSLNNLKINVSLNLDNEIFKDKKILGLDNYALFGLLTNELTVTSTKSCEFNLSDYCLWDTSLTKIKHSSSVTLIKSEFSSNSEFVVEVLK